MSGSNPMIKQEPLDDETPNAFHSAPCLGPAPMEEDEEPVFVEAETVLQRATDYEGRPYPTACFQKPHLQHPHHHRLDCGHDIVTESIERCGRNCARGKIDKKITSVGFACPVPACIKTAGILLKTRGALKPRKCILSHVYGRDPVADQKRLDEKASNRSLRSGPIARGLGAARKSSPSPPPPSKPATSEKRGKFSSAVPVDRGELLNLEFENAPDRDIIMSFSGPGVKQKVGGRFKTDKEIASDVETAKVTRDMRESQMATKEERRERARKSNRIAAQSASGPNKFGAALREADTEPQLSFSFQCQSCRNQILDVRYHCFDCEDFDLCWQCFENGPDKHTAYHRIKPLDSPHNGWREGDSVLQNTLCVCGSTSTSFLVLCEDCKVPFHPGCVGAGAYEEAEYGIGHLSRGACMKHDYLNWKGGKVFRCKPCQKSFDETQVDTTRGHRLIERAKRRQANVQTNKEAESAATAGVRSKKRGAEVMEEDGEEVEAAADELQDNGDSTLEAVNDSGSPEAKRFKLDLPMRFKM